MQKKEDASDEQETTNEIEGCITDDVQSGVVNVVIEIDPWNYSQAKNNTDKDKWRISIEDEITALETMKCGI